MSDPSFMYIWRNALNEVRHRYAGSGIGVFWNIVNPLFQIAIYGVLAAALFPRPGSLAAKALWHCTGLLVWFSFSEGLVRGSMSVVRLAAHIRTNGRPIPVFVAQGALASFFGLAVTLLLLQIAGIAVTGSLRVESVLLLAPAAFLLHAMAFGMCLALASLRVLLPDVGEILRSLLQVWMWSLPLVYETERLPQTWRSLLPANPPYVYVDALRRLIVGGSPGVADWALMVAWAIGSILFGLSLARVLDNDVRDAL